ncbi:MAG: alkaline phosphatase family protein, partial [Mycobacterium sp.]
PKQEKNLPASMPNLKGHTALDYPGWDLAIKDQQRADLWLKQFANYKQAGEMPTVQFVYLPRDHTWTLMSGRPAPPAMVADNDWALGRIVDAVSHSSFWKDTAIFVTEDDAQDGADHVDGHRTVAQIISPYTQTSKVDSTFYSTVSVLHTMELIVGVTPMTQFDATSTPMWRSFTATPNLATYSVEKPKQSMTARNPAHGPMAAICARLDFSHPDGVSPLIAAKACRLSMHGSLDGWPPKGAAQTGAYVSGSGGDGDD